MATDFTEETAADAVIESFGAQTEPRLREVLTALVRHLHAFARDVELTIPEWEAAIEAALRSDCASATIARSSPLSPSGAGKDSERARDRVDRRVDVVVGDVEVRDSP